MFPMLILSSFAGMPLSEAVVDQLVSKRTVTVTRQVMLEAVVYKGDPLGSQEAGTLKVLARPTLMVAHKQTAFCQIAEPDQAGLVVRVTPCLRLDGKIDMNCETQLSKKSPTKILLDDGSFAMVTDTQTIKTTVLLTPGKPVKVRMAAKSIENQTWMEVTATVVENPPRAFATEAAKMTWTVTDTQTVSGIKMSAVPLTMNMMARPPYHLQPTVVPASAVMPAGPIFVHPVLPAVPMMMPTTTPTPVAPAVLPPAVRK